MIQLLLGVDLLAHGSGPLGQVAGPFRRGHDDLSLSAVWHVGATTQVLRASNIVIMMLLVIYNQYRFY